MSNNYTQGKCPKCPSSDAYTEWANGSKHCFACGYHSGPGWSGSRTLEQLHKWQKGVHKDEKEKERGVYLPTDIEAYIPNDAFNWLQKFSLTAQEIYENKIKYSQEKHYLVFPVFDRDGTLLMWQGRYFGDNEKHPKWCTFGFRDDVIHLPKEYEHDTIVIVEDIISAIKVSRVTNCMPMFGSDLSQTMRLRLTKLFKKAKVWVDPDAKLKGMKLSFALNELGLRTTCIFSDQDPKYYQKADIRQILGE